MEQIILQLILAKGIGDARIKKILKAKKIDSLDWSDLVNESFLTKSIGLSPDIVNSVKEQRERSMDILQKLKAQEIEILLLEEPAYPNQLRRLFGGKSPAILFAQGNRELLNKKSVGFCGSRKTSQKGLGITDSCAKQLTEKDVVIVSGYAAGVDLTAHRSALENNGETIFVLSEGILKKTIKKEIKQYLTESNHLFVSQFMPELTWSPGNAMMRNSVIIGLSGAMILVESGLKGGTFEAGEKTLSIKHPLFVVDFANPEASAEANQHFIGKGGKPIRCREGIPNLDKIIETIDNQNIDFKPKQLTLWSNSQGINNTRNTSKS